MSCSPRFRIMCHMRETCIPTYSCFSEQTLKDPTKHVRQVQNGHPHHLFKLTCHST